MLPGFNPVLLSGFRVRVPVSVPVFGFRQFRFRFGSGTGTGDRVPENRVPVTPLTRKPGTRDTLDAARRFRPIFGVTETLITFQIFMLAT